MSEEKKLQQLSEENKNLKRELDKLKDEVQTKEEQLERVNEKLFQVQNELQVKSIKLQDEYQRVKGVAQKYPGQWQDIERVKQQLDNQIRYKIAQLLQEKKELLRENRLQENRKNKWKSLVQVKFITKINQLYLEQSKFDFAVFRITSKTTFRDLLEVIANYWNISGDKCTLCASNWARLDALMDDKVEKFFTENPPNQFDGPILILIQADSLSTGEPSESQKEWGGTLVQQGGQWGQAGSKSSKSRFNAEECKKSIDMFQEKYPGIDKYQKQGEVQQKGKVMNIDNHCCTFLVLILLNLLTLVVVLTRKGLHDSF